MVTARRRRAQPGQRQRRCPTERPWTPTLELKDAFDFRRSSLFVDSIFDTQTCWGWIIAAGSILADIASFGGNSVDFTGDGPLYQESDQLGEASFGATAGSPWLECSVWVTLNVIDPTYGDSPNALTLTVTSPVTGSNSASCTDNVTTDRYACSVTSINKSGAEADGHFLLTLTP